MPSWREARALLSEDGSVALAEGDWSWVYGRADAERVARVTPFDPAYRLFAEVAMGEQANPAAVRVEEVIAHPAGGFTVTMERLDPMGREEALSGLTALLRRDASAEELVAFVQALEVAVAESDVPLLVGLDLNPANLMRRPATGELVLTDALWIHGVRLLELVTHSPADALALYSRADLEAYAHLPCMDPPTTAAILESLSRAP